MATFIKVEREGSDLLRRNLQETQANRLAKVESDEQARTSKQAKDARAQALAAQGLDNQGSPLATSRRRRFRPDEPAASYFDGPLLLLHCDGDNGSTTFVDSGRYRLPIVPSGDVFLSNAQSKFGGTSAFFYGRYIEADSASSGGSLLLSDARLSLGSFNLTIEFWIYPDSNTGDQFQQPLLVFPDASNGGIWGQAYGDGMLLSWIVGAPNDGVYNELDNYLPFDQWHHVAYVRSGGIVSAFVNGTKQVGTYSTILQPELNIAQLQLGTAIFETGEQYYARVYLDELRITKGKVIYSENFIPQSVPFR